MRVLKLAFIYLSGVIGAGFITGREIYAYFGRFGFVGIFGLLLSVTLFAITAIKLANVTVLNDCRDLKSCSIVVFGERWGHCICFVISLFLYSMYTVMIAGSSELLSGFFCIGRWSAAVAVTVLCILLLFTGFQGVTTFCAVAAPATAVIMIIVLAMSGSFDNLWDWNIEKESIGFSWLLGLGAGVVYCGYNMLVLFSVMPRSALKNDSLSTVKKGNLFGVAAVGLLISFVFLGIRDISPENNFMPLLYKAAQCGEVFKTIMVLSVFVTMILSCATNLLNCGKALSEKIKSGEKSAGIILALIGCLFSFIGFGKLMDIVYTFFGVIGVILIIPLVFKRK